MSEIRVITEDLPDYKFPYSSLSPGSIAGYTVVQAREEGQWQPRWCVVDMDGSVIAILEADSFEGLSAQAVTDAAYNFILGEHGLSEEDTGLKPLVEEIDHSDESYSYQVF